MTEETHSGVLDRFVEECGIFHVKEDGEVVDTIMVEDDFLPSDVSIGDTATIRMKERKVIDVKMDDVECDQTGKPV